MAFQTQTNITPAPAVAGNFASATNPRATVLAGPGALVADTGGLTVGAFAWVDSATRTKASNAGSGKPAGFVRNGQSALITTYLGKTSMVIPAGLPVEVFSDGDFWAVNGNASTAAAAGEKVFASATTGAVRTAAAGATVAGYVETDWYCRSAGAVGELIKISSRAMG